MPVLTFVIIKFFQKLSEDPVTEETPGSKEYCAVPLLTNHEWHNYQAMREYAQALGLTISCKVRLADLVNPTPGPNWKKRFFRVTSKHVDFVFCDKDMNVKLIVELDDWSHDRQDRQERDKFVDSVLIGASYQIRHIRDFDDAGLEALNEVLNPPTVKVERPGPTYEEWKAQQLAQTNTEK